MAAPPDQSPAQPDPDPSPILALHRAGDGFISFHGREANDYNGLFSIQAAELRQMFPTVRRWLTADASFSINAFWRPGRTRSRVVPTLWREHHASKDLRYLNAC